MNTLPCCLRKPYQPIKHYCKKLGKMENTIGIQPKELAKQIREQVEVLNELLTEADKKRLDVKISVNTHFKNHVVVGQITQQL